MADVVVSTPAALLAALKVATAGGVILLAPGKWGPVAIYKFKSEGVVSIRSQDPTNPAILPALTVNNSEGLSFSELTLATELYNAPTSHFAPAPFRILQSRRISFDHLSVHGTLDDNPQDDVNGVWVTDSDQISITHCEFQQLYNAIADLRNTHVTIADNSFHDIRNDGIDNGGTSYVTVTGNHFTDFYPVGAVGTTGDHADAIQFWTVNTTASSHDVEISHNTFVRGHGSWIQGVFVTDEVGGRPYQRVTIEDNRIEGGEWNGVAVIGCQGVTLRNNVVKPYDDMRSGIRVEKCTDVKLSHNRANYYQLKNNERLKDEHNDLTLAVSPPFRMRKP